MCCYVTVKLPAGNGRRSRPGTPKAPAAQGDRGSVEDGVSRTLGSRRGARPAWSGDGGSGGRREYRRRWTGEARPRHGPSPRGPPERGRASRETPRAASSPPPQDPRQPVGQRPEPRRPRHRYRVVDPFQLRRGVRRRLRGRVVVLKDPRVQAGAGVAVPLDPAQQRREVLWFVGRVCTVRGPPGRIQPASGVEVFLLQRAPPRFGRCGSPRRPAPAGAGTSHRGESPHTGALHALRSNSRRRSWPPPLVVVGPARPGRSECDPEELQVPRKLRVSAALRLPGEVLGAGGVAGGGLLPHVGDHLRVVPLGAVPVGGVCGVAGGHVAGSLDLAREVDCVHLSSPSWSCLSDKKNNTSVRRLHASPTCERTLTGPP